MTTAYLDALTQNDPEAFVNGIMQDPGTAPQFVNAAQAIHQAENLQAGTKGKDPHLDNFLLNARESLRLAAKAEKLELDSAGGMKKAFQALMDGNISLAIKSFVSSLFNTNAQAAGQMKSQATQLAEDAAQSLESSNAPDELKQQVLGEKGDENAMGDAVARVDKISPGGFGLGS